MASVKRDSSASGAIASDFFHAIAAFKYSPSRKKIPPANSSRALNSDRSYRHHRRMKGESLPFPSLLSRRNADPPAVQPSKVSRDGLIPLPKWRSNVRPLPPYREEESGSRPVVGGFNRKSQNP